MICSGGSPLYSHNISHLCERNPESVMGAEKGYSISQPIFLSHHRDAASLPELQCFYQLAAELEAD